MEVKKVLRPTDGELEILGVLWDKGQATVREVFEQLCLQKECGYTTTLKLLQIMLEKQLVTRDSSSKTHVYTPAVSREQTQNQFLGKMITTLFEGSSANLVMQALGGSNATRQELEEIEMLIQTLKAK